MNVKQPFLQKKKRRIFTIDIEGFRDFAKNRVEPYLIGIYDGENKEFKYIEGDDCINIFLDKYLTKKHRGVSFTAHFGGNYDFPIILDELDKRKGYSIQPVMQGSKMIRITVIDKGMHRWFFSDSSALLTFSLADLTKTFDVGHKKLDLVKKSEHYDADLFALYRKKPERVIEYLKHDCIGLYEVIEKFKEKIGDIGGQTGITIASTALKTFSGRYQKTGLYMCDKKTNDEFRQAYFGGRTEIFKMNAPELKDDYYLYYDINSLYPHVMKEYPYPVSQPTVLKYPSLSVVLESEGITEADVIAPKGLYAPILPSKIKMGYDTKLMFVLGTYSGMWDNRLLEKAKELGYKIKPKKSWLFESEYIFKDYVDDFYSMKLKEDKDTPGYLIAKLLLNCLYGKFGQRQTSESVIKDDSYMPGISKRDYVFKDYVDFDNGWFRIETEGKGKSYLPQISIHVTAMAQLELYKGIEEILDKGYSVFYCDTDSITTDYKNLKVSKDLGDWKIEKRLLSGMFILPKTYKTVNDKHETELRVKGYSRSLQAKIGATAFEDALFKDDMSGFIVEDSKPNLLRSRASYVRNKNFNSLAVQKRSLRLRYNKRKILKDFDTEPFAMEELACSRR